MRSLGSDNKCLARLSSRPDNCAQSLGIATGAELKAQSLAFLLRHFGRSGSWYYEIARGRDERAVNPNRERKSSGSETTFADDLTDPVAIEAGVLAMADDVWDWCEKTGARGRTVTVKVKWADFRLCTRSRSLTSPVSRREALHDCSLALIRSVYPPRAGIRLVGVTLSNFQGDEPESEGQLPLGRLPPVEASPSIGGPPALDKSAANCHIPDRQGPTKDDDEQLPQAPPEPEGWMETCVRCIRFPGMIGADAGADTR